MRTTTIVCKVSFVSHIKGRMWTRQQTSVKATPSGLFYLEPRTRRDSSESTSTFAG